MIGHDSVENDGQHYDMCPYYKQSFLNWAVIPIPFNAKIFFHISNISLQYEMNRQELPSKMYIFA